MDYCTLAEVRAYLGIATANTGDDTLIDLLIDRATKTIDMQCRRTVVTSTATARYFTVGRDTEGAYLWFDDLCASISEVLNGDASATEVTSSQYALIERNRPPYRGIKLLASSSKVWEFTTDPEDAIKVTGKWAYFADTVPDDVKHFAIRLAAFFYRQKDMSVELQAPIVTDVGLVLPAGLTSDLKHLVAAYGRHGV